MDSLPRIMRHRTSHTPRAISARRRAAVNASRVSRLHVYVNGTIETALGVGMVVPQTRRFALAGVVAYVGYLIFGAVRNRRG